MCTCDKCQHPRYIYLPKRNTEKKKKTRTHTRAHALMHARTHARTHTFAYARARARAHLRTCTQARTCIKLPDARGALVRRVPERLAFSTLGLPVALVGCERAAAVFACGGGPFPYREHVNSSRWRSERKLWCDLAFCSRDRVRVPGPGCEPVYCSSVEPAIPTFVA